MTIFFSHSKPGDNGMVCGSKHLNTHIKGVVDKALLHYSDRCNLGYCDDELKELITILGLFHDLGKYTNYFQNYLLKRKPIDTTLKQHARIGGFAAYNYLKHRDHKKALVALYLIFLHHSHLTDLIQFSEGLNEDVRNVIKYQQIDLIKNIKQIETDIDIGNLSLLLEYPNERVIRKGLKHWRFRESGIQDYFLINYLFSLLIEADKLDASDTSPYSPVPIDKHSVDKRFGTFKLGSNALDLNSMTNEQLRNFCRAQVTSNLGRPDILDQFLFTLTSPTGTGKTMAVLDFALKLKARIQKTHGINVRLIYALPFINIIEQALKEYKTTLTGRAEILAHYQYAEAFAHERLNETGEESHYSQKLMASETWQSDIIITSFVQFFETLIGNRNRLLKKFNHFANSIVILDEVQTLRLDQMPLIGAVLYYLSKFLKTRIVLMTATRPKIFELAQTHILTKEGDIAEPIELLTNYRDVFSVFSRTKIIPVFDIDLHPDSISQSFIERIFAKKWSQNKSCIIVCNTVNRSIEIHDTLVSWLKSNHYDNEVEYLSTNIIPAHRLPRIEAIKSKIKSGRAPILVSTQVVEAGVDLDFDMGFRDIGPIDSVIQVAGRINRNNDPSKSSSPLYIIDFGDGKKIYGRITYDQARSVLSRQSEFEESEYLNLVERYFDNVSDKKSFSRFNEMFESMKLLRYDSEREEERPVSAFKIIEESDATEAVFIELGDHEAYVRKKYLERLNGQISKQEFNEKYKLDFHQRIISIPAHHCKGLRSINQFDNDLKVVTNDLLDQYYRQSTGFIRKHEETITFL